MPRALRQRPPAPRSGRGCRTPSSRPFRPGAVRRVAWRCASGNEASAWASTVPASPGSSSPMASAPDGDAAVADEVPVVRRTRPGRARSVLLLRPAQALLDQRPADRRAVLDGQRVVQPVVADARRRGTSRRRRGNGTGFQSEKPAAASSSSRARADPARIAVQAVEQRQRHHPIEDGPADGQQARPDQHALGGRLGEERASRSAAGRRGTRGPSRPRSGRGGCAPRRPASSIRRGWLSRKVVRTVSRVTSGRGRRRDGRGGGRLAGVAVGVVVGVAPAVGARSATRRASVSRSAPRFRTVAAGGWGASVSAVAAWVGVTVGVAVSACRTSSCGPA